MREKPFTDLYREFIVDNAARNRRVAEIAGQEAGDGRAVLVLVEHVRHGENLMALLPEGAAFAHGSVPSRELRATTAAFAAGEVRCLVATSGLFTEGVSIDGIHVLVQAGGLKSRSKVIQTVGRGMRLTPGKPRCDYFDFFDDDASGVLRGHARQRLRVLKEEGFFVPPVEERRRWEDDDDDIPTTWAHVAGTKRFYQVDGDGRIAARAVCVRKELVPETICKRCRSSIPCAVGGRTEWRAPRA
ncbi:MAG: hypothetical protein GY704_05295 [Phycisphaeraceae bacterium]|nr:hypothetical protein [Phycisphaeraceae bacterium]